jgi:hypothetical protein
MTFITEIEKSTLKFIWKHKRTWRAKAILNKKSNAWHITISNFKLYYKTIAIKTAWYWQKQTWRPVEQNRGPGYESTQLYPPHYLQRCQKHAMEERQTLQQILLRKVVTFSKKLKLDPCLSPCTSSNSKWIKDLNIRHKTLKLLQEEQETLWN